MRTVGLGHLWNRIGGPLLFRAGRVGRLTTTGRRSGQPRVVYVGYVALDGGRYLVGAGGPRRSWAANLRAYPTCTFQTTAEIGTYTARLLGGVERERAEAVFRARLGRWASGRRWGDIFELVPSSSAGESSASGGRP
jgi:deazaflavin-dependent oxidoreductase (nitroreductase family)